MQKIGFYQITLMITLHGSLSPHPLLFHKSGRLLYVHCLRMNGVGFFEIGTSLGLVN